MEIYTDPTAAWSGMRGMLGRVGGERKGKREGGSEGERDWEGGRERQWDNGREKEVRN